ncbi:nucleotidyltransferase domain-containing protein [Dictyobacter aurantiacus]|uniref:Nucleotidyltransferase n=1 Tax=Dictyobacter aurantiacus TaxID=1936993 RepID=A0A401Z8S3_9CHLR|nr:nucleotidyltransferase domain-containing protein [Dictyobacter aurantiacus]GCE03229.1 nucleotidyltransferase [Dictyobacter aurantiacus]
MNSVDIARAFVQQTFPNCKAAILAGSASRGEETDTSDLDILVIVDKTQSVYEESLNAFGRAIDVLFYTHDACRKLFKMEIQRRRPVVTHMCAHGIILKDPTGLALQIQDEAWQVLRYGPEVMSQEELDMHRNELTDQLDDFIGAKDWHESNIVAFSLIVGSINLVLSSRRHWIGAGKWLLRELQDYDPQLAQQCVRAMDSFYKQGRKDDLIAFVEQALDLVGGRLDKIIHGKKDTRPNEGLLVSET